MTKERAFRITLALIKLLLVAFGSFMVFCLKVLADAADESLKEQNEIEDKYPYGGGQWANQMGVGVYNHRTRCFDNGSDPAGWYD